MTAEVKGKLIQDLKQFGLNPKHWALKRIGALQFKLQHKEDPGFILLGHGKFLNARPKWEKIQILSF